jgi:esterase/lipase superfamily enzyme/tetratricopeptide (TPR) repeat protein
MLRAAFLVRFALFLTVLASPSLARPETDLAALNGEVESLYNAKKYAAALPLAFKYLDEAEKTRGPEDLQTANAVSWIGAILLAQKRYAEAEPYLRRVVDVRQKALGPLHRDVGVAVTNLAFVCQALGKDEEAERLFKQAIDVYREALGPAQSDFAIALANLAGLYSRQARYAEAKLLLQRSVTIFDKSPNVELEARAVVHARLAKIHELQGESPEAEALYRRAIEISERGLGPDHVRVALMRGALGGLLKAQNRLAEARPLLQAALATTERAWGARNPLLADYLSQLGDLERLEGRCDKAETFFGRLRLINSRAVNEIPVFFSTDRSRDMQQKSVAFGVTRARELSFGLAMVTVPKDENGATSPPQNRGPVATEGEVTEIQRLALHCIEVLNQQQFIDATTRKLQASRSHRNQALVYIHGYSASFEGALRRAAQIATDINFDGSTLVFSWPAREQLLDYLTDRDTVDIAVRHLRVFLTQVLTTTQASKIHFIAHSMGNLLLLCALEEIAASPDLGPKIGEVINAAPDVDRDAYVQMVAAIKSNAGNFTLYASSLDWALWASSTLRSYDRAGYFEDEPLIASGFDTLDITRPAKSWFSWFSLNHDVYASDPVLVADMKRLISDGARPPDRRTRYFERVERPAGSYWKLRSPDVIERLRRAPEEIVLEGLGQTARVSRTGPDTWEWRENEWTFYFRSRSSKEGELVLYDKSRDMYHHLFLDTGQTFWRIGTTGTWNLHYVVISVR